MTRVAVSMLVALAAMVALPSFARADGRYSGHGDEHRSGVSISLGFGFGGHVRHHDPVYVPAPVYAPAPPPVVYAPPPAYYPVPVYHYDDHHESSYYHHDAPRHHGHGH